MEKKGITLYLKLNPIEEYIVKRVLRNVRSSNYHKTEDFEITIKSKEDFKKSKKYLDKVYELH